MGYHILTPKDAAAFLDISEKTLEGWRSAETGPTFYRMGGRLIRYFRSDLEAWLRKEQEPTTPTKKPKKTLLGIPAGSRAVAPGTAQEASTNAQ